MKRIYMIMVAACIAASATAQVKVGPKVGMNLYKISDNEEMDEGAKEPFTVGFNFGVATSFGITDNFTIAPELIFTQKGAKTKYEGTEMDFDGTASVEVDYAYTEVTKLNYLEMPVLGRVAFGSVVKGYINAGPSLGYWLGGKVKEEEELGSQSDSYDGKIKFVSEYSEDSEDLEILSEDANRVELSAVLGGGIMLDTPAGDMLLDLRYQAGLTNLVDYDEEDEKIKNYGLSVSLIYLLGSR